MVPAAHMNQAAKKRRLTIATLNGAANVWPVLTTLLDAGFGPEQVSLAAVGSTLHQLAGDYEDTTEADPSLGRIVRNLRCATQTPGHPCVAATPGFLLACLGLLEGRRWFSEDLRARLETHILGGGIIVGVECDQAEQQWASVRILLGQVTDDVRTFEFTRHDDRG